MSAFLQRKNKLTAIIFIIVFCAHHLLAQSSSDIYDYVSKYGQIALEQEKEYGIPASITLAQGILESGAGRSLLVKSANNHFGVKAYGGWTGPVYLSWDDEKQKSQFRSYSSANESFKDHALFLKNNSRYRGLFENSVYDYRAWAIGLQVAGYATAGNYAKALIGYIDAYQLYALNGGVKLRAGKTVKITKVSTSETPVFNSECVMNDSEESEEEQAVVRVVNKVVVEINEIRCEILHPGEVLASISLKYDIPKDKLLEYNEVSDESSLKEGDIVFLQKKKNKYLGIQDYYRVKADDTLYSISQQFGIKLASLAKMNGLGLFSTLREGEKLRLK